MTEAEPLLRWALSIKEQQLEAEHRDPEASLNNLAELYENQVKYSLEEPLFGWALALVDSNWGS